MFLCWSPYLIAFYPGTIDYDMLYQLNMACSMNSLLNNHPLLSTFVMGLIARLGHALGGWNFGAFLYILFQTFVCAGAYAYTVLLAGKLAEGRPAIPMLLLAFYCFVPVWGYAAQFGVKDILYTGLFSWFAALLTEQLWLAPVSSGARTKRVFLVLTAVLTLLTRHNGKYIVFPLLAAALLIQRRDRSLRRFLLLGTCLSLGCYFAVNLGLVKLLGIPGADSKESLSLPFQATARCVREHGDEITLYERQVIGSVLSYDAIGESYVPRYSDPVKAEYLLSGSSEEKALLKEYRKVWLRMFAEYPQTYLEALVQQSYGYYAFIPDSGVPLVFLVHAMVGSYSDLTGLHFDSFGFHWLPGLPSALRSLLVAYGELFQHLPLLGLLHSFALYTWAYVLFTLAAVFKKKRALALYLLPLVLNAFGCCASPVNNCLRYFLPMMAVFPLFLCLTAARLGKERTEAEASDSRLESEVSLC